MRARGKAFLKELVIHPAQIALLRAPTALVWHVWPRLVWHICFQNKTALSHSISCYSLYSAMVWYSVCLSVLETKDPLKEPDHGMFVFSIFDPVTTSELEQYPFYFPLKLCVATISQYDNLVKKNVTFQWLQNNNNRCALVIQFINTEKVNTVRKRAVESAAMQGRIKKSILHR